MVCEYSGCNAPEGECMGECLRNNKFTPRRFNFSPDSEDAKSQLEKQIDDLEKEIQVIKRMIEYLYNHL